jgi:hypothetical protein
MVYIGYLEVPFIIFGTSIATFIFSHLILGALLLLVVFFFVGWPSRWTPIAVCAVAFMAVDPAYIFTWRTQAYITTFPTTFVLLALWLILKADDRDDRRWLHALSGALIGAAFWGYFIHIFFVPGIILSIYLRNRLDPRQAAALIGFFVLGLCCGAFFYFIGYALYFKQLGLWGGIEWMRRALASMTQLQAAEAEASLRDRLLFSFSMLRLSLTGEFHDIMIFGGGDDFPLQKVKMALFILTPLGVAILIASRAATASACLPADQADQQCECSQAWPVDSVPNDSNGSWACSALPQRRQLSGDERAGLRLSHSATQQAKARASACSRGSPPSNSAMPARSSKKARQSSSTQLSRPMCRTAARSSVASAARSSTAPRSVATGAATSAATPASAIFPALWFSWRSGRNWRSSGCFWA